MTTLTLWLRKTVIRKPLTAEEKRAQLRIWRRKHRNAKVFGLTYIAFCLFYVAADRLVDVLGKRIQYAAGPRSSSYCHIFLTREQFCSHDT